MSNLLTGAQLARWAGVDPSFISNEKNQFKKLVMDNRKYDLGNDINASWCRRRGLNPEKPDWDLILGNAKKIKKKVNHELSDDEIEELTGAPRRMMGMQFRSIMRKYGTLDKLSAVVEIWRKLLQAHKIDVDTQSKRGELLPAQGFNFLFSHIQLLVKNINDNADSVVDEIITLIKNEPNEKNARIKGAEYIKSINKRLADEATRKTASELEKLRIEFKEEDGEEDEKPAKRTKRRKTNKK